MCGLSRPLLATTPPQVRRVSCDATLEPKRKAYLMQNLFTVRWLVAQQNANEAETQSGEGAEGGGKAQSVSQSSKAQLASQSSQAPPPPPPPEGSAGPGSPSKQTFVLHPSEKVWTCIQP